MVLDLLQMYLRKLRTQSGVQSSRLKYVRQFCFIGSQVALIYEQRDFLLIKETKKAMIILNKYHSPFTNMCVYTKTLQRLKKKSNRLRSVFIRVGGSDIKEQLHNRYCFVFTLLDIVVACKILQYFTNYFRSNTFLIYNSNMIICSKYNIIYRSFKHKLLFV